MRFFPHVLTQEESNAEIERMKAKIYRHGWGVWAVELGMSGELIGMVGLNEVDADEMIPQTPFIEIVWRLHKQYWGKGYAYEAATACLEYAFSKLKLRAVYAFTAMINKPSWRLMQKLGMHNTNRNFNHPKVVKGSSLERHCLYKITRACSQSKSR